MRLTEMVVACIRINDNWQWADSTPVHAEKKEQVLASETLRHHCREKHLTG